MCPCWGSVHIWIRELKNRSIKEFEFENLPKELKDKKMIYRGKSSGKLKKIKRTLRHIVWQVM